MIQSLPVTPTATPQPLSKLASWAATRGLRGVQMLTTGASISYGGRGSQSFPLTANALSDVLPIAHLNDLYVVGNGADVLNVICFL